MLTWYGDTCQWTRACMQIIQQYPKRVWIELDDVELCLRQLRAIDLLGISAHWEPRHGQLIIARLILVFVFAVSICRYRSKDAKRNKNKNCARNEGRNEIDKTQVEPDCVDWHKWNRWTVKIMRKVFSVCNAWEMRNGYENDMNDKERDKEREKEGNGMQFYALQWIFVSFWWWSLVIFKKVNSTDLHTNYNMKSEVKKWQKVWICD